MCNRYLLRGHTHTCYLPYKRTHSKFGFSRTNFLLLANIKVIYKSVITSLIKLEGKIIVCNNLAFGFYNVLNFKCFMNI